MSHFACMEGLGGHDRLRDEDGEEIVQLARAQESQGAHHESSAEQPGHSFLLCCAVGGVSESFCCCCCATRLFGV